MYSTMQKLIHVLIILYIRKQGVLAQSRSEHLLVGGCFLGKALTVQSRARSGSVSHNICNQRLKRRSTHENESWEG